LYIFIQNIPKQVIGLSPLQAMRYTAAVNIDCPVIAVTFQPYRNLSHGLGLPPRRTTRATLMAKEGSSGCIRSITRSTCVALQCPPRWVGISRAFSPAAHARPSEPIRNTSPAA
jgi:hypothetical protein